MHAPTYPELEALEENVCEALETLDTTGLAILGYGEVTTVFGLNTARGVVACKRFPIMRSLNEAQDHIQLVTRYVDALAQRGVHVVNSELVTLPGDNGRTVMYLVQPIIKGDRIGPNYFHTLSEEDATEAFGRILDAIANSVTSRLAPDGQLSNWAFVDGDLLYIDVSTPFMRDESGKELVNWEAVYDSSLRGITYPLRGYFQRKIPEVLEYYYSVRGQALDFLANLRKEKLDHFLPAFIPYANERLDLDPPLTFDEVRKYYNENADVYALMTGLKRVDRIFHRYVLRRPYPNFIPPRIDRNKF